MIDDAQTRHHAPNRGHSMASRKHNLFASIPTPDVIRPRLAASIEETTRLQALLSLSVQIYGEEEQPAEQAVTQDASVSN